MDDPRSARELYNATAAGWVRSQPLSLSDFTGRPPVLELCEPIAGRTVLDLGCGEGYCARQLRARGAAKVVGVDVSLAMIEAAEREEGRNPLGIRYSVGNATGLESFADSTFDTVLAMFLYNYLTVQETLASFADVARVLRPSGTFVFAVPHPCLPFFSKGKAPFYFDPGSHGYFSGRDVRFPGRIWKRDGTALDVQCCHKTLEDYFATLNAAGFRTFPTVRELHVTPEILAIDPPFFTPLLETPLHLAMAVTR